MYTDSNTPFIVNKQYCTKKNTSWWVKFNDNATGEKHNKTDKHIHSHKKRYLEVISQTQSYLLSSLIINKDHDRWHRIPLFCLTTSHFVFVPSKNLDFRCHLSWSLFMINELRWEVLFILLILMELLTTTV